MLRIKVILLACMVLSGCALTSAYNLREGIQNFKVQNYRAAFIRLLPEAEKGQRDAQYAVGYMYYYGQGVVEDRKRALYWVECAAKSGQQEAITALRIMRQHMK